MPNVYNLKIPPTLLRLGTAVVDRLFVTGLRRRVTIDDVQHLMDKRYPDRKRAANAQVKIVSEGDLAVFNMDIESLLDKGISHNTKMSLASSYTRGYLTIRVIDI